jgi:hypothetical protein
MNREKRNLYQCFNAKVVSDRIKCLHGHFLGSAKDGSLALFPLVRGNPLECTSCQECMDYEEMGPSVPSSERGWKEIKRGLPKSTYNDGDISESEFSKRWPMYLK